MISKVLLTDTGCRYSCIFCNPFHPSENDTYVSERTFETIKKEVDSTSKDCQVFVVGGSDCCEDLELLFRIISYIRGKRGDEPEIHVQSHCGAFQDIGIVEKLCSYRVSRMLIPLYGSTEKIHHNIMAPKPGVRITGFPQLEAIENAMKLKISIDAHTVIAKTNQGDLINIVNKLMQMCTKYDQDIRYEIVPIYYIKEEIENYIPFKDLSPTLNKVHKCLFKLTREKECLGYMFVGFPFCLFDRYEDNIINSDFIDTLKKDYIKFVGNQLPSSEKIYSKVDPRIPSYRIRTHAPICKECIYENQCAGFQLLDYEAFGIDGIRPFLKLNSLGI